ncbi:MAG: polysaccharide deacetylase family protein [Chthoniobacterales bacterium]|nr:polysaccharide deacetylase family protein [Chthoniobacterales bacterium]
MLLCNVILLIFTLLCGCSAQLSQNPLGVQIYSPTSNSINNSVNGKVYELQKLQPNHHPTGDYPLSISQEWSIKPNSPYNGVGEQSEEIPIHPEQGESFSGVGEGQHLQEYQNPKLKYSYNSVQTTQPIIAITFDDGPHPQLTPKLLDILKQRGIRATFYLIGKNVEAYPDIVRRIVAEGHEIGNHSYSHYALTRLSPAKVAAEINKTQEAIRHATGILPQTLRPPYGATNEKLNRRFLEEFGLLTILWSVDPQDWRYRNSSRVTNQILLYTKPGDIILSHDIHPTTIAAMPATLDGLIQKGFRFLTVSELLSSADTSTIPPPKKATAP